MQFYDSKTLESGISGIPEFISGLSGRWRAQFIQPAGFYIKAIQIWDEYEEIRQHAIVQGSPSLGSWPRSGLRGCSTAQVENEANCQNLAGTNASIVKQVLRGQAKGNHRKRLKSQTCPVRPSSIGGLRAAVGGRIPSKPYKPLTSLSQSIYNGNCGTFSFQLSQSAGKERGGEAARWENPPLIGGMSPKATGGKTDACLLITLESQKQTSINHPIRQLR